MNEDVYANELDAGQCEDQFNHDASEDNLLALQPATTVLREKIFYNSFIAGAESTFSGILTAGESVPAIGNIFTILKKIKNNVDLYIQADEECARLSVWCQAIATCLGKLAGDCRIDTVTSELLTAVHTPLKEFSELIQDRVQTSKGVVGKMVSFGATPNYKKKSALVQEKIRIAVDALKLQLAISAHAAIEKVMDRSVLLLDLDVKMDEILDRLEKMGQILTGLDAKVDILLQDKIKKSEKEIKRDTHAKIMSSMMIQSSKLKMEDTPFARGGSSQVFRAVYSKQTVAAKVQVIQGVDTKKFRNVLERFEKEVGILCQLSHPHVLRVWGACADVAGSLILVMEYAQVCMDSIFVVFITKENVEIWQ